MAATNATSAKTGTSTGEEETLQDKVLERIDFFFGDVNFKRDRFLRARTMAIPDRYIPISVLLSFNTLKAITLDAAVVAAAAATSSIVEVNEAGVGIRRKIPLVTDSSEDEAARRIHAAGFPVLNTTWKKVAEAFSCCGKVTYVRLRRDRDTKSFLGSAFIDFGTKEAAAKAVESPPEYEGKKLVDVKMLGKWLEEARAKKGRDGAPYKPKKAGIPSVTEIEEEEKNKFILRVSGYAEDTAWQDIKRTFVEFSETKGLEQTPAFVDLHEGVAFLRYNTAPDTCASLLEELKKSKTRIGEAEVAVEAANSEEREAYWVRMFNTRKEKSVKNKINRRKQDRNSQSRNRSRKNNNRGGRSFRNKRQRNDAPAGETEKSGADAAASKQAEPPAKKPKSEDAAPATKVTAS